jgi:hypothetical protein
VGAHSLVELDAIAPSMAGHLDGTVVLLRLKEHGRHQMPRASALIGDSVTGDRCAGLN